MIEVVCEDCRREQTTTLRGTPECEGCGSRSLTATIGYDTIDPAPPAGSR